MKYLAACSVILGMLFLLLTKFPRASAGAGLAYEPRRRAHDR